MMTDSWMVTVWVAYQQTEETTNTNCKVVYTEIGLLKSHLFILKN